MVAWNGRGCMKGLRLGLVSSDLVEQMSSRLVRGWSFSKFWKGSH